MSFKCVLQVTYVEPSVITFLVVPPFFFARFYCSLFSCRQMATCWKTLYIRLLCRLLTGISTSPFLSPYFSKSRQTRTLSKTSRPRCNVYFRCNGARKQHSSLANSSPMQQDFVDPQTGGFYQHHAQ